MAAPGLAAAGPPPATTSATVFGVAGGDYSASGSGLTPVTSNGGTASVGLAPAPSAQVSGVAATNTSQEAQAVVDWYIDFSGATGPTVKVDVTLNAAASAPEIGPIGPFGPALSATDGVSLSWGLASNGYTSAEPFHCGYGYGGTGCPSGPQVIVLDLPASSIDFLQIVAGANAGWSYGPAAYSASIDPTVTIDPAYLRANSGVTFSLSANVGNGAAATPEPATWALMLVGFGGLGAAIRAHRRADRELAALQAWPTYSPET